MDIICEIVMERLEVRLMGKRRDVGLKKVVLDYAEACGKDAEAYRGFGVSRSTFYE